MRKKDEEIIEKVVNRIIDSNVLLTGDGDFCVGSMAGEIMSIAFCNLFSSDSKIKRVTIRLNGTVTKRIDDEITCVPAKDWDMTLWSDTPGRFIVCFGKKYEENVLETSPSFKRLVEYIKENKHLILHNDKEYGKSHTLTDTDFI